MRYLLRTLLACALVGAPTQAHATASTAFWSPATNYVQPYLVPHVTYDSYVSEKAAFQNDYGLTLGVLPFEKLQAEVGVDWFVPGTSAANLYVNAKLGVPEGALAAWSPGLSAGIVGLGFKRDVSDFDVLHAEVGKTFPIIGTLVVGGYYGLNPRLMVSSTGATQQAGLLAAWTSPDWVLDLPGLKKVVFLADVQTGHNAFGAVGGGVGLYFTPTIDLLTGPVFLFDPNTTTQLPGPGVETGANRPGFLWSIQLDIDFDLRPAKPQGG